MQLIMLGVRRTSRGAKSSRRAESLLHAKPVVFGAPAPWETGQGRSNCQMLFGMLKIPGDSQIRAKRDALEPEMFHPVFADLVAELTSAAALTPCDVWMGMG